MGLPEPGDPHFLGIKHMAEPSGQEPADKPVATIPIAKKYVSKNLHMSLKELPAEPQTQAIINAVLVFHMMGLSNNEIAIGLNITIPQVMNIKEMTAYQETFELLHSEFISSNSSSLQSRIASYAAQAVENVMTIANESIAGDIPPIVILKANQDILDRSGLSSDALFGKNSQADDMSLKIVIENTGAEKDKITVNFERK